MTLRGPLALSLPGLALVAILASACGSGGDTEIRPLDEILSGPVQITDLTSSGAVVRVETELDVVCSVVYGTDDGYGRQSTDLDMAGRAHSSHAAALRDLEPDTVYHYRLQGSASDGTLYVSEDMTFRTPAAEEASSEPGPNLAAAASGARVLEASSQFGGSAMWAPGNAIDGDPDTEWSSAGDGDEAFITVELAQPSELQAVGLWTRTMGSSAQIMSFRVITEDGSELGPFGLPGSNRMYVFPVSARGQRLRFEVVESSGGNTGVVELAAYGRE